VWADSETDVDFLNYSEVAGLTADLIRTPSMRPLSVGVFGTWGTGKSTLLNLIERELQNSAGEGAPFLIVRFDAWLYQGFDDARAALMEVIGAQLLAASAANESVLKKAKTFLGRVNYFRAAGLLAEGGAAMLGFPTFGALAKGVSAIEGMFAGPVTESELKDAKAGGQELIKQSKGLLRPEEKRTPPEEIAAFRSDLGDILLELKKTLVVFLDNLDRCLPKQTIHTLEALRLFLFMPNTAFVVAADEDMVRHSVAAFFDDLDDRHVTDYLDKLIQVPMRVPRLGVQEVRAYMFLLFAIAAEAKPEYVEALRCELERKLRAAWKEDPITRTDALKFLGNEPAPSAVMGFEIADRMAPLLANSTLVQGNPRIVKRLLNVVRLRSRLAVRRSMQIDEALIAKLALFERCTDAVATGDLYKMIQESPGGKSETLRRLENLGEDPEKFKEACPEAWKPRYLDFVREWISLEPKLGEIDLRPALYLSRETQPLKIAIGSLSPAAADALRTLLKATNPSSPAARGAMASVSAQEYPAVMEAVLGELRKHENWKTRPQGFSGALIVAEMSPGAGQQFNLFLKTTFPDGKLPPWVTAVVKNATWFTSSKGK